MDSDVLSVDRFVEIDKFMRRIFCFYKYCEIQLIRENKQNHENTPDEFKNTKSRLACCNGLSIVFCTVCYIITLERRIDRGFWTNEHD